MHFPSIRKFALIIAFGMTVLSAIGAAGLAAAAERPRIAVLISSNGDPSREIMKGLMAYLKEEGTEADYDLYPLQKDAAKATKTMLQIRQQDTDLILALGSLALDAACGEKSGIPLVATMILDKRDFERCPDTTGVPLEFPMETQFEMLRRFLPEAKTIGVIHNPEENGDKIELARVAAKKFGLRLEARKVSDPKDLPSALENLANSVDVLWGISDRLVLNPKTAKSILLFSFRNRIPFVGLSSAWVKAGAFYALDRDYVDIGRQCGEMAQKVLQGTAAGSLAAATPKKVNYSLNLKTARQMKVHIARSLVRDAVKTY